MSYHHDDYDAVESFVDCFGALFGAVYTRGVTDGDDFVASPSDDVIIGCVRDRYLRDASLAIVLLSESTWSRRFIDWEIAAALGGIRQQPLALATFAIGDPSTTRLPPRLASATPGPPVVHCLPRTAAQLRTAMSVATSSALARPRTPADQVPLLRSDIRD